MVLKKLGPADKHDVNVSLDCIKEALDQMVESSANYVDREHLLPLWDSLHVRKFVLSFFKITATRVTCVYDPVPNVMCLLYLLLARRLAVCRAL